MDVFPRLSTTFDQASRTTRRRGAITRRLTRIGNRIGVGMYRGLGGRLSSGSRDVHVLLITTPGRRTGLPRSTCVRYIDTRDGLVVWGTGSGSRRDPDWFRNLRSAGYAEVQIRQKHFRVLCRELRGTERDDVWNDVVLAEAPEVAKYARRAARTIPVALLQPVESLHPGALNFAVWIQAEPEQVWNVYVDPRRIPEWQTGKPVIEDIQGVPGEAGSSYVSRRGRLAARTRVVASDCPTQLVSRTDAYFGCQLDVTSHLRARAGGTDLELVVETHWRSPRRLFHKVIEQTLLNRREALKELTNLKRLVER